MKDFLKLLDLFDRFFLNEKLDNLKKIIQFGLE